MSASGGTGSYADKNVGADKAVTASGVALTGAKAGNYVLSGALTGNVGAITPKTLAGALTADDIQALFA